MILDILINITYAPLYSIYIYMYIVNYVILTYTRY